MSGLIFKTLTSQTNNLSSLKPLSVSLSFFRHRSSKAAAQVIEIDLSSSSLSPSSSSSPSSGCAEEAAMMRKLEEMVRRIIVQKSTPDWLPFVPGSSFWVPPPRRAAEKIADVVDRLTNQLTEEESLSVTSLRCWPCSSFFIPSPPENSASTQEVDLEFQVPGNDVVELKLELLSYPVDSSKPEDEEK